MDKIPPIVWDQALVEFRDRELSRISSKWPATKRTQKLLFGLRELWRELAKFGVSDDVQFPTIPRGKRPPPSKRPSLAETVSPPSDLTAIEHEAIKLITSGVDPCLRDDIARAARSAIGWYRAQGIVPSSLKHLSQLLKQTNCDALDRIRQCAEADILWCIARWKEGHTLLKKASHSGEELALLLDDTNYSIPERRANSSRLLFQHTETALGNTLAYILHARRGIVTAPHGRVAKLLMFHRISTNDFNAFFHPTPKLNGALALLIAVDTPANCYVIRDTPFGCLQNGRIKGTTRVQLGYKAVSGAHWVGDIPDVSPKGFLLSTPQAIRFYIQISERLRSSAPTAVQEKLLMQSTRKSAKSISNYRLRELTRAFQKRHKSLRLLNIAPSFLRGSYLICKESQTNTSASVMALLARHKSANTVENHYLNMATRQAEHFEAIRSFQSELETIIVLSPGVDPVAHGIDKFRMSHLLSSKARTGLGPACIDNKAGIQAGTIPGESCHLLENCPSCLHRYVVATPENIADFVLIRDILQNNRRELRNASPATRRKWATFVEVVIRKLIRAGYGSQIQAAQGRLTERSAHRTAAITILTK